jgi:hypothetical protein
MTKERSNGATASYYELPAGATQLQDLISDRDMNAQIGEVFRACYRYGRVSHSDKLRDAKKILFYAQAEVKRLEMLAEEMLSAEPVPFTAESVGAITAHSVAVPVVARNCATCGHPSASKCDRCDTSYSHWSPR